MMKALIGSFIGLVFGVSVSAEPLLEGQVRLESGEPVADAQVRLFDLSDLERGAIARAMTDGTGYFALPLAALSGRALPARFALGPNYPNPFNPSTIIPYQLAASAQVRLEVFNLLGQHIATLVDGERAAGSHTATWHAVDRAGRAVGAGVYIYRMTVGVENQTGRMVLIDGQVGVSAAGAASVLSGVAGGGSDRAASEVYGLLVSGAGLAPYVDSSFRVEAGMAPVELVVSSGHSGGKAADDDCAFCDLFDALNDDDEGPSPSGKAQAVLAAPPAPTNLRFDAPTDSSCTVRWDAAAGATDYDVNYKPAVGGEWTNEPHRGTGLYNTINDLEPGTEYRWAVRAENGDGSSAWVFGPNFTTLVDETQEEEGADGQAPAAPTNLRFDAPTDSSCTVRWDAAAGASDYDVNYKPAVGGRWTNEPHRGTGLYNTINDLEPRTEYRWAVRAENGDGSSAWVFGPNFTTLADETTTEEEETDSTSSEGGPDLIVQSPSVSAVTLTPGQEFTLQVTVHNQGDEQAAATTLHYYRSNNARITSSDTEVGTGEIGALDASATRAASISLTAPSTPLSYYYGACVTSVSDESNTDNNCSDAVRITVIVPEVIVPEVIVPEEGFYTTVYTPETIPYDHLRKVIAAALGKAKSASITEEEMETLWRSERSAGRWPSAKYPVGRTDVASRLAAAVFLVKQDLTPPESVRAHPLAADFPGPVPADAPRLTRTLTIDTTEPRGHSPGPRSEPGTLRWHSTGLYAAPGELVTVSVPSAAARTDRLSVRVGAHSDANWARPEWTRMPKISRRFPISSTTTHVANAFGGLIYIEVPVNANLGKVSVKIEGAVAAPLFVLGETDLAAWRNTIRHAPAPWAEIVGRNMIVTTDAREVRGLGDPAAVAETWDRVLDLNAELATWPSPARLRRERFVVDRQISVGYMHAGYPIMAYMDQSAHLVDALHISTCQYDRTQSNWGFFHEVGHNHQSNDWTFDGTVEVTVNLFTLYVHEFLCGIPVAENWRGSAAFRAEQMTRYDFDNPDFELWKDDPFLALVMYVQLQQAFGWDAYRQVFATYRALPDAERPKSDNEKRDQWLVRFSRQVGRNLGPFFEAWGVPTSRAARASIADLPVWLPPDFP